MRFVHAFVRASWVMRTLLIRKAHTTWGLPADSLQSCPKRLLLERFDACNPSFGASETSRPTEAWGMPTGLRSDLFICMRRNAICRHGPIATLPAFLHISATPALSARWRVRSLAFRLPGAVSLTQTPSPWKRSRDRGRSMVLSNDASGKRI